MSRRDATTAWTGGYRRYDIVKEFVVASLVVVVLTVALAVVFSSLDEQQITIAQWSRALPGDFVATAVTELDGTSGTATYGAPYTRDPAAGQRLGPLPLQRWGGVTEPINTAQDFVLRPLSEIPADPVLAAALTRYTRAPATQQQAWATAYDTAVQKAGGEPARVAPGTYGPVPVLLARLLRFAQSGGLDGVLLTQGHFYQTDYTRPLMFISDGSFLPDLAQRQHLLGSQWGMMNETGNFPGQAWLWLYTFWYQVRPFSTSDNADALVWGLMMVLTVVFVLVPFVPGVRSIPRLIPVYRLIWRDHYRSTSRS